MSDYEVRDPQRSAEWTAIPNTWNTWASVRAFLALKGYKAREFVDAPRVFEVRHPFTSTADITEVRVSVPLRLETHVKRAGFDRWCKVGKPTPSFEEEVLRKEVLDFVENVAAVHDPEAHDRGAYCPACQAKKLLAKLEERS